MRKLWESLFYTTGAVLLVLGSWYATNVLIEEKLSINAVAKTRQIQVEATIAGSEE